MDGGAQGIDPLGWLTERGQAWLDSRLAESTAARQSLKPIDGKRFEIVLTGPELCIGLTAAGERLLLSRPGRPGDTEPDARLTATPLDALSLARSRSLSDLKQTDAHLDGNIHVAESFAHALGFLSPDPEAELAGWVGDVAAHDIVAAGKSLAAFLRRAGAALEQNTAELFTEEQPTLARPLEVEEFVEDVDDLRDAVERAASRLDALARRYPVRAEPAAGGREANNPDAPAQG